MLPVGGDDVALNAELPVVRVDRKEVHPCGVVGVALVDEVLDARDFGKALRGRFVGQFVDVEGRKAPDRVNLRPQRLPHFRFADVRSAIEPSGLVDDPHAVFGGKSQLVGRRRPDGVEATLLQLLQPCVGELHGAGEARAAPVGHDRFADIPGGAENLSRQRQGRKCQRAESHDNPLPRITSAPRGRSRGNHIPYP